MTPRLLILPVVLTTLVAPVAAQAQTAPAQTAPAPAAHGTSSAAERMAEARKRYSLGLKLYEDGNYEAARIEFERALELAPSYKILYNVGLAYKQLNNYVDALRSFQAYLEQGGTEISEERRAAVEKEIAELRPRIAKVSITTNVPGAEISIDDVVVGKAPLREPILVNPGVRKFSARASSYFPAVKSVTIGSSESPTVNLDLAALPKYTEKKSNPWVLPTVIGWSATGAAAVATTVFGILSLNARSDQEDQLASFGATGADLQDARDKTVTLSTVTNILGVSTIVLGGASIYMTLRMISAEPDEEQKTTVGKARPFDLKFSPTGFSASGTF